MIAFVREEEGESKVFSHYHIEPKKVGRKEEKKFPLFVKKKVLAKSFTSTSLLGPDIFSLRPLDSCNGLHRVNFTNILRVASSRVATRSFCLRKTHAF